MFLFIIYIHNELQCWSKSWNVSGYFILVILISVFGHQGASICLKIGKNRNIIIPVHNLHAQWIAILWQIMKSIWVQHFSHVDFCIWPPGGIDMSKNWRKSKYQHFSPIDYCNWPPGGSNMSKNWKKIIISSFLLIIYIHNELQSGSKSWNVSGYYISVILMSVFGHQGASMTKNWRKI